MTGFSTGARLWTPGDVALSRRWFLALAGGAVLTGYMAPSAAAQTPSVAGYSPSLWCVIDGDGRILVHVAKAEMGQHVGTALARILAEELEADWEDVELVHVDPDPKWGYMITGGSWSVNQSFEALSRAGAAGRIAMIEAGAAMLGAPVGECVARDSVVRHGDRAVSYGEIVAAAAVTRTFSDAELAAIPLKPPSERRLLGRDAAARDVPAKVTGSTVYGVDRRVDGMVYARPVLPPTRFGCRIASWTDDAARAVPGYLRTVEIDDPTGTCQGWLVAVADNWPAAAKAAELVDVRWETDPATAADEADMLAEGARLVGAEGAGSLVYRDGDPAAALAAGGEIVDRVYRTHTVLHMQMEPANAIVWRDGDRWRVHAGDQHPSLSVPLVAKALGVAEDRIAAETSLIGGGFGRRLYCDFIVPAALAAKAMDRPVKLVFSRSDDAWFDNPRSPTVQRIRTVADPDGSLQLYDHVCAAGWPTWAQTPGFLADGFDGAGKVDPFAISGADHWYDATHQSIRLVRNERVHSACLPGYLRAVAPGYTTWAVETHIDELAIGLGVDPAAYRLSLLGARGRNAGHGPNGVGGALRLRAVLERAMEKAGWSGRAGLPDGEGMGIALGSGQEREMPTWSATVAHVAVDRRSGEVVVKRLVGVFDAGTLAHPDGALAQVEGGMLWGLSMALHESAEFKAGAPQDLNFDTYRPVAMPDVPAMEIEFLINDHMPVGLGEPGVIGVAPAIGNAIFDAVGARLRDMPIRPAAVLKAMEV
jgi:isoquinoline 1-oxidoreductase subunit beta